MNGILKADRLAPSSVRFRLTAVSIDLLLTIALLAGTVSMLALSVGDPELAALVTISGAAVFGLTLAMIRLLDRRAGGATQEVQ